MAIQLHQFVIQWDLPNPSPFCLKLETWMRMAGIDYAVHEWTPMAAPQGKAPFVVCEDGTTIPDSGRIIRELTERFEVTLDAALTPAERAQAHLVGRTLEEHTYFAIIQGRWLTDDVWNSYRWVIGQPMPALIRRPLTAWLRRDMRAAAVHHGLGRHPAEEIMRRGIADVDAVMLLLGDQPFLFGDMPTSIDATVYAFFAVLVHPIDTSALATYCRNHPVLMAYVERMRQHAWADWAPNAGEKSLAADAA